VIARGILILGKLGSQGYFYPITGSGFQENMDTSEYPEVLARVGRHVQTHSHRLFGWWFHRGMSHAGRPDDPDHFHFDFDLESTVECKPIHDGAIVPAALLDSESRTLSNGEARIDSVQSRGMFWPQDSANLDKIPKSATSVQMSGAQIFEIRNVWRCSSPVSTEIHFHFEMSQ